MIRLLYLSPVIAIIGFLFAGYLAFYRPVTMNNQGKNISASQAIEDIKGTLQMVKIQQDLLAGSLVAQKNDLIEESTNASKLYEQVSNNQFEDMDLVKLKASINDFNQQALDLASDQNALIQFNDQLRDGIAALDKQVRKVDIAQLLRPKHEVENGLNAMRIQTAKLVELQREIIEKSRNYNERAKESIMDMKAKLKEQSQNIAALKTDRSAVLQEKINDTISRQDDMLSHVKEQEASLNEVRKQNLEQLESSKERVAAMVEQMKDRMADVRDKMQDAKEKARDARERAKDMQQALKDRMNK